VRGKFALLFCLFFVTVIPKETKMRKGEKEKKHRVRRVKENADHRSTAELEQLKTVRKFVKSKRGQL